MRAIIDKLTGDNAPVVGLDVGLNSVKAIRLTRQKDGRSRPEAFYLSRRDEGIVDEEDLFAHLPDWLAGIGLRNNEAVVGVPQHITTVQITSFPSGSQKALEGMVAFQTRQLADLSDDRFVHDYCIMKSDPGEDLPVVIGVCLENLITERCEKYAAAGVNVVDFGMSGLAMASAFLNLKPELTEDGKVYLLLDIGTESTTMVAIRNGRVHFCGTLDFGGDRYQAALAEKPKTDQEDAGGRIRRSVRRPHIRTRDQESALGRVAQMLVGEIRSGIEYWQEQHEDDELANAEPAGLFLCGGGARLPGLLDFLERSLACEVGVLQVPGMTGEVEGLQFVTAYGLALQAAKKAPLALSLAPDSVKWHALRERRTNLLACVAALLVVGLASLFAFEWRSLDNRNLHLDREMGELNKCEDVVKRLEKASEQLQLLEIVQLPVLEHGNRAKRFSHALAELVKLKGAHDWLVYFGDREAFDSGKPGSEATTRVRGHGQGDPVSPFAAPVFETISAKGDIVEPVYPVAGETEPSSEMVFAGYTPLDDEPYKAERLMAEKINAHPFFIDADVLPASEAVGREDIFIDWTDFLDRHRRRGGLKQELKRVSMRLSFSETAITDAPQTETK